MKTPELFSVFQTYRYPACSGVQRQSTVSKLSRLVILAGLLILASCSNLKTLKLNSVQLTNQLRPGMSYGEVENLMGKPKSSQVSGDRWIVRYNLQEMWRGYIPYDLVFKASDRT